MELETHKTHDIHVLTANGFPVIAWVRGTGFLTVRRVLPHPISKAIRLFRGQSPCKLVDQDVLDKLFAEMRGVS